VPRGTANTAERRLSSDCGPATPWWVWGVPHAARARAAQRQTERKHSRLRGAAAGEDRAAAARLGARGRGRAQSLSTFSKLIQSRLYPVCTKHFALARSGSGVDHDLSRSVLTGLIQLTTRPDLSTYRLFKLRSSLSLVSRDARSSPSDMALCTSRLLSVLIRCRVPRIEARHSHAHNPRLQQQTRFAYCTFPAKNEHECTNVHS
jgi:hypothetical protein